MLNKLITYPLIAILITLLCSYLMQNQICKEVGGLLTMDYHYSPVLGCSWRVGNMNELTQ